MDAMKIIHVVTGLGETSGVATFCLRVAAEQRATGATVRVWCHHRDSETTDIPIDYGTTPSVVDWEGIDLVHIHALWSLFLVRAMRWCWGRKIPFIVSPHGSLMPRVFTKSRVKKWVTWHLLIKPLVKRAALIHCTSEAEKAACEALGLKGPFVVAPLGVDVPEEREKKKRGGKVLFLGRLGEEKGLEKLLEVWKKLGRSRDEWRLVIAGPDWEGYGENLRRKVAEEKIAGVEFTGPADAEMKDLLYREADVFVLPSPMENFSMVVLEALAYGVPAIATKGTPWAELAVEKCGWWIEQGVEPLRAALAEAMALTDEARAEMGARGRELARTKYSWKSVVEKVMGKVKGGLGEQRWRK